MKIIIGFILGFTLSAFAQDGKISGQLHIYDIEAHLNAGVGPDNKMAPIRVDKDGYVICSKE